jgi:hypothetical protein
MQVEHINETEHEDMIASFWMMLQECEARAFDNNDPVLRHWVEGWYRQWNRITNDNKKARWDTGQ